MSKNTGGPAFPTSNGGSPDDGMTLRDYFAIHSVQPGCGEIAAMAGYTFSSGAVWSGPDTRIARFDDWFGGMPLPERLALYAKVQYAMADAMLKAREK